MPSTYVSAEWVINDDGTRIIKAIGDDGSIWWVPEVTTDVAPWPDFLKSEAGKAFAAEAETWNASPSSSP